MSRKGFTLLELIVVMVIIGVLATLGFNQYGRMIERARGAEARSILGDIRKYSAAYYLENGAVTNLTATLVNIGTDNDQIPSACADSHYFSYALTSHVDPTIVATATRCIADGKTPDAATASTLILTSNMSTGVDAWSGTGGY
ncbi:MAG: type II secretion system protein [Candidatus Omnitrophota bacterium]